VHKNAERVRLNARGLSQDEARGALLPLLLPQVSGEFELSGDEASLLVQFTRAVEDDVLDRVIRSLQTAGGRILSCESERATLLDVLEQYEHDEHETAGGMQK
jgi:hypothetical protein